MTRNFRLMGAFVLVASTTAFAQDPAAGAATDPILGMWTLNLDKSRFSPGPPPEPGSIFLRRYTLRPDGFMVTIFVTITSEGPTFLQTTWKYDGQDYPLYAPGSLADFSVAGVAPGTIAYRAIDAYTTELTSKDNTGKVTFTGIRRRAVSSDGRTLIDISRGTNAQGQPVDNVLVFDRCDLPCFDFTSP